VLTKREERGAGIKPVLTKYEKDFVWHD